MKHARKLSDNQIFNSIRKATAPPSQRFKTRRYELERKAKHKAQKIWEGEE